MLWGSLTTLDVPDEARLKEYTATALFVTPDTGKSQLAPARAPAPVIPTRVGLSPIKHVFYVIRENRTYDQVPGDLPRVTATRRSPLGENTTPNAHA